MPLRKYDEDHSGSPNGIAQQDYDYLRQLRQTEQERDILKNAGRPR